MIRVALGGPPPGARERRSGRLRNPVYPLDIEDDELLEELGPGEPGNGEELGEESDQLLEYLEARADEDGDEDEGYLDLIPADEDDEQSQAPLLLAVLCGIGLWLLGRPKPANNPGPVTLAGSVPWGWPWPVAPRGSGGGLLGDGGF